jgi:hypothetical protein
LARRPGRPDQILGARVVLTAWTEASESELNQALAQISETVSLTPEILPVVVLEKTSREKAGWARDLLEAAGGTVSVGDVWVTREEAGSVRSRPACPSCGSGHTQPYPHAGPGSRVNMKCTNCGHLFRDQSARS